jgi:hypothetical protein
MEEAGIEYLYDFTLAIDGILPDDIPEDIYGLGIYAHGSGPVGVHVHIRRWHIPTQVPIQQGQEVFSEWLNARWEEKDAMLERFHRIGSLATGNSVEERIRQTVIKPVRLRSPVIEIGTILAMPFAWFIVCRLISAYFAAE